MTTFAIEPLDRFRRTGAVIKRPTEITCFSYDSDHKLHHDSRSLKYYYTPELNTSLSEGFEDFRKLDDDAADEHIDALLASIIELEKADGDKPLEADFVTWRGMMTKADQKTCWLPIPDPYSSLRKVRWVRDECYILSRHNVITPDPTLKFFAKKLTNERSYIEENKEYKIESRRRELTQSRPRGLPSLELMSYWGYKFETLSMLPDTWDNTSREHIETRPRHTVDNYEQYCSIARTGVGDLKLVIGGEVDGVWDVKQQDPTQRTNWVELKTSAEIVSDNDVLKFERKLNKFWAQSFLLGVPRIIVGFRTNDMEGRLLRVQEFETTKIPGMVRNQGKKSWDSNICINFLADFLSFLKDNITTGQVWKIRRREKSPVIEVYNTHTGSINDILSADFIAWREQRSNGTG